MAAITAPPSTTSPPSTTAPPQAGPMPGELYRFSLGQYRQMGPLGLLGRDDRVELLDGLLVKKMTKGPRHTTVTHRLYQFLLLNAQLPAGWTVRQEAPIELPGGPAGDSVPEPDVAVVAGTIDDYGRAHPGPGAVALVVEVASDPSRVAEDRRGLVRYAWAGVPVVWVVNLADETVEVYTGPARTAPAASYAGRKDLRAGDVLELAVGGTVVAVPVELLMR